MFERSTVFILGSGASWHYGYPTGEKLIEDIQHKASAVIREMSDGNGRYNSCSQLVGSKYITDRTTKSGRDFFKEAEEFFKECQLILNRLRSVNPLVIDYFLGFNVDLQEIGRLLIAWVILEAEAQYGIRAERGGNNNKNRIRIYKDSPDPDIQKKAGYLHLQNFNDDWYRFIIHKLTQDCKKDSDLKEKNNVKFITFNYDVSAEKILYFGLKNIHLFQDYDFRNFINPENFIHVYGAICEDTYSKIDFSLMRGDKNPGWLKGAIDTAYEASKGIKTIDPHDKTNEEIKAKAQKAIKEADDIYILGYGFDKNNNARLDLKKLLSDDPNGKLKRIHFTNYEDRQVINKRASEVCFGHTGRFYPGDKLVISFGNRVFEKSTRNVHDALERDFDF